jgi:ferredoxin
MNIKKLDQKALDQWVTTLIEKQRVFGVQAKGSKFIFDNLNKASDLRLDYDVTILPPKKYFLPQKEELLSFENGVYESIVNDEPFILFGVHPYDLAAIRQMDKVFSADNYDSHYMQRRNNATIVAVDVQNCAENNFSACMNTATGSAGCDLLLTGVNGNYLAEAITEKGTSLLADVSRAADADQALLDARQAIWDKNNAELKQHTLNPQLDQIGAIMENNMEHPVWEQKAELCFSCGSCVLVCPTCYCFDVADEVEWDLKRGKRVRKWDGCMLLNFATVAGDHNFRPKKIQRFRHRYLRKGKYVADKIGEVACVGCGRCVSACVAKIANPVDIFNTLGEEK